MRRSGYIALAAAGLVLVAGVAWAHVNPPSRRLMLQLDDQGVVAVVELSVGGRDAQLLAATYDLDRDGRFSDGERTALAAALVAKGLRGLSFRLGATPLTVSRVTPRLDEESLVSTKIVAVGLVELGPAPGAVGTTDLTVAVEREQGPLSFMIQALDHYRVLGAPGLKLAGDGRGFRDAARIQPGESLRVRITRLSGPKQ